MRLRVLIADDYPEMVRAIRRLLAKEFEVVECVEEGGAVLEATRRLQPDVVVLDLSLPNGGGLEACRKITRTNPGTKVIVLTAQDDPSLLNESIAAGASAFLSKLACVDLPSTIKRLYSDRV
jgi:DNA-binding NarL/FixJ family response regulator